MSHTHLVIMRHGRTAYNNEGRLQGQIDIPLDDQGQRQVERAAKTLVKHYPNALVVASDLQRAAQSAAPLWELLDQEALLDQRLRERSFGAWEGLLATEIAAQWPEPFADWRNGNDPQGTDAEPRGRVADRVRAALTEHLSAAREVGRPLIIVTHGAVASIALGDLLGQPSVGWRGISGLDNANWSVLVPNPVKVTPDWRLLGHNISGHHDAYPPGGDVLRYDSAKK